MYGYKTLLLSIFQEIPKADEVREYPAKIRKPNK